MTGDTTRCPVLELDYMDIGDSVSPGYTNGAEPYDHLIARSTVMIEKAYSYICHFL